MDKILNDLHYSYWKQRISNNSISASLFISTYIGNVDNIVDTEKLHSEFMRIANNVPEIADEKEIRVMIRNLQFQRLSMIESLVNHADDDLKKQALHIELQNEYYNGEIAKHLKALESNQLQIDI